jgi:hypothetical protein
VEAADPIRQRVARGEEQHRRLDAARAKRLAHIAAVGVRKADVEHEHIRWIGGKRIDSVGTRRNGPHLESLLLESVADHSAQLMIVLADATAQLGQHGRGG